MTVGAVVLFLFGCGQKNSVAPDDSELLIVGGEVVSKDSQIARLTVSLVNASTKRPFCSGVLIASDLVLTAAHCVAHIDFAIKVTRGIRVSRSISVDVLDVRVHESYNEANMSTYDPQSPTNDLATLRLATHLQLESSDLALISKSLTPIDDLSPPVYTKITLAGFGLSSAQTREGAGVLRAVQTEIVEVNIDANEFTFGGHQGKSACRIDSGGPAFITSDSTSTSALKPGLEVVQLIGISSRGSRDCMETGVYTLVSGVKI